MSKYTPGPWSTPHFAKPEVNCECGYVLCDHMMGAVATVHCSGEGDDWKNHGDNPKFEEAVANAHLISAAPDLIMALEDLTKRYCELVNSGDCGNWNPETEDQVIASRAALAKAKP